MCVSACCLPNCRCETRYWNGKIGLWFQLHHLLCDQSVGSLVVSRIRNLEHNIWGLVRDPRDPQDLTQRVPHLPTWEDCQQLLQVLFTTEERERTQAEAQKSVLGEDRQPTQNPDLINAAFPLSCPTWDYNSAEDDILLVTEDRDTCLRGTKDLLQTIAALGYQASAKKAQICRAEVSYLGYKLKDGQRWLTDAWK
ncbi:uncharacterized protein LOC111094054 isoform X1 [Canis lupus familiaris]|uniref:uncharacterized protein LOC111094054 isoform X1 n=1 Tax=Canis lupus familiaris TaxID=9615 RepID=UPI000BAA268D|nr:uncharacterized protein LOC111094054 isoform X1 [Canis lupus familiaris]XP_038302525.1 uncharacterized protein LOC111094054 isoform X1 [Canis lupus familiaris]XP_038440332.1 uncharacterized protein LOC111094054 isoform X1 [Canis lupus familiaris]|eukprot:XP_022270309.1 uncharacterized protein LOC111094054 [Canis lupus familiaris]